MELRQLEYFMALCEELHFTKTAEKLRIGQPTLSYQMKALEDELGVRLFDRLGKKIAITEAGKILLEHCKIVFENLKYATEQIEELQNVKRGKLVIGALSGDLSLIASKVLLEFHAKYPHVQIQLFSLDDPVEKVKQNEIDLALTFMPRPDDSFIQIPLYQDEFYLVVRKDHAWAERDEIEFGEIRNIPLILNPIGHCFRKLFADACLSVGVVIQPIIESTDSKSILELVEEGIGATIISSTLFSLENTGILKAIKITNPAFIKKVSIVHHKQKYIGSAAKGFIELLMNFINENRALEKSYKERQLSKARQ
ncbi:LysR family transcriptional regulator [Bacillus sp. 7884-1]|uniref:LysR family transcriptional regulator n=1 Tax=Bacillus sp. 7884-1 TaxID=2021693 RepID=UPI000BA64FFC|nr:LysR family transcriptional regulator [Bacillus sp. 7884-1]PAE40529.1 LysR family transcriptional regulator [Bacillus sp. 7884-1]